MRRTVGTAGALVLLGVGVVACSNSQGISDAQFGWTVAEGLMLLSASDPTVGTVVLAASVGNCEYFKQGVSFTQIASSDFLTFQLEAVGSNLGLLPLTAGTYNITVPTSTGATQAGLYGISTEYETTGDCSYAPTGANSGTLLLEPFSTSDAGTSSATWTLIFGDNRFQGANNLTTCIQPANTPGADAGTCEPPAFP